MVLISSQKPKTALQRSYQEAKERADIKRKKEREKEKRRMSNDEVNQNALRAGLTKEMEKRLKADLATYV